MTIQEARQLKTNDLCNDGKRLWTCRPAPHNPHDLWFWWTNKKTKKIIAANGGTVRRVYLGSKNAKPDGLRFLSTLYKFN